MTNAEIHRHLEAVAASADAAIDECSARMSSIRKELTQQATRARKKREAAERSVGWKQSDLLREAELIESIVRQIRKAME